MDTDLPCGGLHYFILPQIAQMNTDFYHVDEYVLNTNITNLTLIFLGTRMDTDEHGFTVRMLFLNTNCTNCTNIFGTRMDTDFYHAEDWIS